MAKTPRTVAQPDKYNISNPTSTTVRLGSGSFVTIAGIQYAVTSNIDAVLPALSANSLYFMYAVISGGAVTLTISQNVNSVGPGTSAWRLVGAFYSNGLNSVGFGSFVNIRGVPKSGPVAHNGSSNLPNFSVNRCFWSRNGDLMQYEWGGSFTGTPAAGTQVQFYTPFNVLSNTVGSDDGEGVTGLANCTDGGQQNYGPFQIRKLGPATFGVYYLNVAGTYFNGSTITTTNNVFAMSTGDAVSARLHDLPISGWAITPLEDL